MKLKIVIILIITLFLSGCFKEDGQIRIASDIDNAIIYIDGDKKGMTGDGYTTIIIEEGDHKVRIYKEKDKEWFYEGEQDIFVGANSSVKVNINTDKKPTKLKIQEDKESQSQQLKDEKKKIYIDFSRGLMWQDTSKVDRKNWFQALRYCDQTYAGYDDWRLPTYNELLTIKNDSNNPAVVKGIKNVFYKSTYPSDAYWSSSNYISNSENIKKVVVFYKNGKNFGGEIHSDRNYVRCVRNK